MALHLILEMSAYMKKQKRKKKRRRNKSHSHQGTIRNTGKRKSWLLIIGGVCCAAILGFFIVKSFWYARDVSEEEAGRKETQKIAGSPVAEQYTEENLEQETMAVLNRLVKDFPNSVDPLGLMGDYYAELGKTAEAMKCWQKCVELQPQRADSYVRMAYTAVERGEFEKAVTIAKKALTINPEMPGVNSQLGRALRGLAKPKEALAAFEKAVKISPNSAENHRLSPPTG